MKIAITTFIIAAFSAASAADLSQIQEAEIKSLTQSAASQKRVDRLGNKTAKLTAEYRAVIAQIDSLKKYNRQMAKLIAAQKKEKIAIKKQIKQAGTIDRRIFPLMHTMLNGLEKFINLDTPFLLAERGARITTLRELMARSDVAPAEKFRKILQAYEIEMEYGRTIETWQGSLRQESLPQSTSSQESLPQESQNITVNFVRFGRLSWVYQTFNREQTALWDRESAQWLPLYGWSSDIYHAIKVAREQTPPSLLLLPIKEAQ